MPIVKRNRRRITCRHIQRATRRGRILFRVVAATRRRPRHVFYLSIRLEARGKVREKEKTHRYKDASLSLSPFKLVFVAFNHRVGRGDPETSAKEYAG